MSLTPNVKFPGEELQARNRDEMIEFSSAKLYTRKTRDKFKKFMNLRFPKTRDKYYIDEWAERWLYGSEWTMGDSETRKVLIKVGRRNNKGEILA